MQHLPDELPPIDPENFLEVKPLLHPGDEDSLPFTGFSFSHNGQYLAAVDCMQTLKVWELASGKEMAGSEAESPGRCEAGWQVAFSPSGRLLATTANRVDSQTSTNVVRIWTFSAFYGVRPVRTLETSQKSVTSLAFSPDGRILAAGTKDNRIRLWFFEQPSDPSSIGELGELSHPDWVMGLSFSPDGRTLAAATAEEGNSRFTPSVKAWDVTPILAHGAGPDQSPEARTFTAQTGPLRGVAFSPDGRLLAASGAGVTLWEAASGQQLAFLEVPANALAFSPDSSLLAAAGPQLLLLWDIAGGFNQDGAEAHQWASLEDIEGDIESLGFSPKGRALATLTGDGVLQLWGSAP